VVIDHAIWSKNVDVQSISGHSSISGACNSIIIMNYLQDSNNKDIKKEKKKRLEREARLGVTSDMVIVLVMEIASINYVVDFDNYYQEEDQKKLGKVNNNWLSFLKSIQDWSNENNKAATLIDFMKRAGRADRV